VLNWNLLTIRNFAVIGAIAIIAHVLVSPLLGAVDGDNDAS